MAVGYYTLTKAADPQAVCTLFEAEAGIDSCTVAGTIGEVSTDPIDGAAVWEGTLTIDATGGTFTIGDGTTQTAALAYDITSANLQVALRALAAYGATLTVTGDGPHVIILAQDDPALVTVATSLTGGAGTATLATTQAARDVSGVLVFPNRVVFKVRGDTVSAITTAAAALISDTTAYPEVASGYPAPAI